MLQRLRNSKNLQVPHNLKESNNVGSCPYEPHYAHWDLWRCFYLLGSYSYDVDLLIIKHKCKNKYEFCIFFYQLFNILILDKSRDYLQRLYSDVLFLSMIITG